MLGECPKVNKRVVGKWMRVCNPLTPEVAVPGPKGVRGEDLACHLSQYRSHGAPTRRQGAHRLSRLGVLFQEHPRFHDV